MKLIEKERYFFVFAGNKSDLCNNQVVSKEERKEYVKSINALFFEISATDHEYIIDIVKI